MPRYAVNQSSAESAIAGGLRDPVPPELLGWRAIHLGVQQRRLPYLENSNAVTLCNTRSPWIAPRISRVAAIGCRIIPIAKGKGRSEPSGLIAAVRFGRLW
jgi:hypothetical protein